MSEFVYVLGVGMSVVLLVGVGMCVDKVVVRGESGGRGKGVEEQAIGSRARQVWASLGKSRQV